MAIGILGRHKIGIYNRAREKQESRRVFYRDLLLLEDPESIAQATIRGAEEYLRGQNRFARLESKALIDDAERYRKICLKRQTKLARREEKATSAEADKYVRELGRFASYDCPDDDGQADYAFTGAIPLTLKPCFGRNVLSDEQRRSYPAFARKSSEYRLTMLYVDMN